MPRFAANLSLLFTELDFLDRFESAAQAGFEAVEFLFPYAWPAEVIRERLDGHGLRCVLHNLPPGDWDAGERGIACLPDRRGEFEAGVELALEYAAALGVEQLHCLAGVVPDDADASELHETYVANLRHACRRARDTNRRLLIEPINTFDIPGYYLCRVSQAMEVIEAVGEDNLFLQFDIYHAQRMQGELVETLRRLLPRIAHVQFADNPGRHEPGTGEINFDQVFAELDAMGYAGTVSAEYLPRSTTAASLGWFVRGCAGPRTAG